MAFVKLAVHRQHENANSFQAFLSFYIRVSDSDPELMVSAVFKDDKLTLDVWVSFIWQKTL